MFDPANIALIKKLGGGASSWNDLKDKPFWEEREETILLNTTTITTSSIGDHAIATVRGITSVITPGVLYEVSFDGETYSCAAEENDKFGEILVGNAGLSAEYVAQYGAVDTGEPFCLVQGDGRWIFGTKESGEFSVSVKTVSEAIKPIDPKFIVLTSPNGTKYNLAVADDGTLSATEAT